MDDRRSRTYQGPLPLGASLCMELALPCTPDEFFSDLLVALPRQRYGCAVFQQDRRPLLPQERTQLKLEARASTWQRLAWVIFVYAVIPPVILVVTALLFALLPFPVFAARVAALSALALYLGVSTALVADASQTYRSFQRRRARELAEGHALQVHTQIIRIWRLDFASHSPDEDTALRHRIGLTSDARFVVFCIPAALVDAASFPSELKWTWMPLTGRTLLWSPSDHELAFEKDTLQRTELEDVWLSAPGCREVLPRTLPRPLMRALASLE